MAKRLPMVRTMRRVPPWFAVALGCAAALLLANPARGEAQPVDRVKAAFVYQFARFVDWPDDRFESPEAPIRVRVLGNDGLRDELKKIVSGKTVNGRPVVLLDSDEKNGPLDYHMIFVDSKNATRVTSRATEFIEANILTIGDTRQFTQRDGIIRLYEDGTKLKIEINIDAAKRADLKISSKLLSLADVVGD